MAAGRKTIVPAAVTCLSAMGCHRGGGIAVAAIVVLCLPLLGWAFDNASGTFFILGLMVMLTFAILVVLLSLLALH